MKNVLVCGDLVWDTHIARLPDTGFGYSDPHLHTQLTNRLGGAWYLRDVIQELVKAHNKRLAERKDADVTLTEEEITATIFAPADGKHSELESENCPSGIAKGFSVWKWFEGTKMLASAKIRKPISPDVESMIEYKWPKGQAEPGAWRITEFLGCRASQWDKSVFPPLPIINEPEEPDVLVIDDLGLGFANHSEYWPKCLENPKGFHNEIIVKGIPRLRSALWKQLLNPNFELMKSVTLVISVEGLRDMGASISRGMSWDRTIEDFQREFSDGGAGWALRECARIVVTCGRSGAAVFSRFPRTPREKKPAPTTIQFERFLFDPIHLEDTWSNQYEGTTFGTGSLMTAALVGHALVDDANRPSTHITVGRGLTAARELLRHGGGHDPKDFQISASDAKVFKQAKDAKPWAVFQSAFPRELLDDPVLTTSSAAPTLLTDSVGTGKAFLMVTAEDIVRFGHEHTLAAVPRLQCGKYFTVDREEIENLNTVRNLIQEYRAGKDPRPLSIAVFGTPGSGKSFAIKQLAEEIFGEQRATLEFNMSQFRDLSDLHEAFHEVRDKSIQGQIPLVFWDEFDSNREAIPLGWIKEFLAPMQDSIFQANGKSHPFGRCIFIFAGGTSDTFQKFDQSDNEKDEYFPQVKGPDFISRLRGFVNIKGPNPTEEKNDEVSIVRRGILLRALIERHHPQAIHSETKQLIIHPRVLAAFLEVDKYRHGSRSMEAIVSLCHLHENSHFGPSELPPQEVIRLHVSKDFAVKLKDNNVYHMVPEDIEILAEFKHSNWWESKKMAGYIFGLIRDDNATPPTHPLCRFFHELDEPDKEANRLPARLAVLRLESFGYRIIPDVQNTDKNLAQVADIDLKKLSQSEHRRWMREKLLKGYAYAPQSNDELLLHRDICKGADLPDQEPELDVKIIEAIFRFLRENNLALVK